MWVGGLHWAHSEITWHEAKLFLIVRFSKTYVRFLYNTSPIRIRFASRVILKFPFFLFSFLFFSHFWSIYFLSFLSAMSPRSLLVRVKVDLPQGSKYSLSSSTDNQLLADQSHYTPYGQRKCWIIRTSYKRNKMKIPIFKWLSSSWWAHKMEQVQMKGLKSMCCISLLVPLASTSTIFLSFYVQRRELNFCFPWTK